jgi:thioredoxin reductase/ferredoxin
MPDLPLWATYAAVIGCAIAGHLWLRARRERGQAEALEEARAAGLAEPPSLHPRIDPARCVGSGSCVTACPEEALGLVAGKAVLVNASACIGHGACHAACAFDAISLVFGTEKRGVDIPLVKPNFETNVPGLFIAGELGGMGLIRKAAEQGRQAMHSIAAKGGRAQADGELDVVIVGAGPAGLSASLTAIERGLRYQVIEQESGLGGAIFHYPRNKIAMTAPVELSLEGQVRMSEISKEELLEFWTGVVQRHRLDVRFGERMERIEALDGGFRVHTQHGRVLASRAVLLAIGRRGTPRQLGVPGEDLPKVVYRLIDALQYRGQSVLVVGGGDSALEAAIALAGEPGTRVTLSYRSAAFSRVKPKNRDTLERLAAQGRVDVLLNSEVEAISDAQVSLRTAEGRRMLDNEAVIVCAGGLLPTPLLKQMGIQFETKYGTR